MFAGRWDGMTDSGSSKLEQRLKREITGDVLFDPFNRGRYATDASFYQIMPAGVVVPRSIDEALRALAIAREAGRTVTPRGGGTSQCGQTVNDGIVIDFSKHLNRIISFDAESRSCVVESGIVLDDLNRQLRKHGLWFPVDVSTASRASRSSSVIEVGKEKFHKHEHRPSAGKPSIKKCKQFVGCGWKN